MSWIAWCGVVMVAIVLLSCRRLRARQSERIAEEARKAERERLRVEQVKQANEAAQAEAERRKEAQRQERLKVRAREQLAHSIRDLRVKRVGDSITIYRCPCFFLRAEIDAFEQSVSFVWRFDLWKRAEHVVDMWYMRHKRGRHESSFGYEKTIKDDGTHVPASSFRKDSRVVRNLAAGATYEFLITASVPGIKRSFVFAAHIPSAKDIKAEQARVEVERTTAGAGQTLIQRYKGQCDEEAKEIRSYIAEVETRTDLSEEDKRAEMEEWETILFHQRAKRMCKFFGIGTGLGS